jgi:hypothetical protein
MKDHSVWCRELYDRLNDKGVWGMPRTGVVFRKDEANNRLVWVATVPPENSYSISTAAAQLSDFMTVREQFQLAGIKVEKAGAIKDYDSMADAIMGEEDESSVKPQA